MLLLSCYELGHAPTGLASPAGFLEAAGYPPALQDLARERLNAEMVARAGFVGISVPMHTALRLGMKVAERVRALNARCHICFYGLYAPLNEDLLLGSSADSVIGGEYEPALVALVEAMHAGRDVAIAGVSRPRQREAPRLARTQFAAPTRAGLPESSAYARLMYDGGSRKVGYVEASRGCKHMCLHCPIPAVYGGRFFVVPREIVLEDIARQVAQGAGHITFGDPDFLNGPGHALKLVQALHERFPQVSYDLTAKVEHILKHAALIPELARTGCLFVASAVESLSDTVLHRLAKGHTRADIERALHITREAGVALRPTWVAFTPWTTLDDYIEMLAFVHREGLVHHVDAVQFTIRLLVPPGSALLNTPQWLPYQEPLDPESLAHPWRHPDSRMDALHVRVSALVEQAAGDGTPAEAVFEAICREALSAADRNAEAEALLAGPWMQPAAPRLTEPWFC